MAIRLDPSSEDALTKCAYFMILAGRPEELFPLILHAAELNPNNVAWHQYWNCRANLAWGRYDEVIDSCERSASQAKYYSVHAFLAAAYAQKGVSVKAAAAKSNALARKPEFTIAWFKASCLQSSNHKLYQEQLDKYVVPGLRKAGFAEK